MTHYNNINMTLTYPQKLKKDLQIIPTTRLVANLLKTLQNHLQLIQNYQKQRFQEYNLVDFLYLFMEISRTINEIYITIC